MANKDQIRFQNPPVIEVVFQVNFPILKGIGTPHFGMFWSLIRDEFPKVQSAVRLGSLEFSSPQAAFPENRLWLVHKSGETLIQLQDDRFLFNWRLTGQGEAYPGYDRLYPEFSRQLSRFCEFLDGEDAAISSFTGFELHYVNHIYLDDVVREWKDASNAFLVFDKPTADEKQFPLTSLKFSSTSQIAGSNNVLIVGIDSRRHSESKQELLNFETRISGKRDDLKLESLQGEFSEAHDQILKAFLGLTTKKAQKQWEPK
jgi:uncharacterized protein (TIGR04255 family)